MDTKQQPVITTNNALQNMGENPLKRTSVVGNLSIGRPTIEEMNAGVTGSLAISEGGQDQLDAIEPAFGEHIK